MSANGPNEIHIGDILVLVKSSTELGTAQPQPMWRFLSFFFNKIRFKKIVLMVDISNLPIFVLCQTFTIFAGPV